MEDAKIIKMMNNDAHYFRKLHNPSILVMKAAIILRWQNIKYINKKTMSKEIVDFALEINVLTVPWLKISLISDEQASEIIIKMPRYIALFKNPTVNLVILAFEKSDYVASVINEKYLTDEIKEVIIKNNPNLVKVGIEFTKEQNDWVVSQDERLIVFVFDNVSMSVLVKCVENNIDYIYMLNNPPIYLQFKAVANGLFNLINNPHKSVITESKLVE